MEFGGMRALVTGASSGIGAELAEQLAAAGSDLVLVARRETVLHDLATQLRERHGVRVSVQAADLSEPNAAERLVERVDAEGSTVDLLVNNAGFGLHGDLAEAAPARMVDMVQVNCTALVDLTTRLLPGMLSRGRGGVLNVASLAAYLPLPHMAVYAASKAFVLSFSEALWAETRSRGIHVTALCPGPVDTEFFDIAGQAASVGPHQTPAEVAAVGLRAWRRGVPSVGSGRRNALLANLPRIVPRRVTTLVADRMMTAR
jgi:short-subunit dehydrogenase